MHQAVRAYKRRGEYYSSFLSTVLHGTEKSGYPLPLKIKLFVVLEMAWIVEMLLKL
jgi:hypothetical protein